MGEEEEVLVFLCVRAEMETEPGPVSPRGRSGVEGRLPVWGGETVLCHQVGPAQPQGASRRGRRGVREAAVGPAA